MGSLFDLTGKVVVVTGARGLLGRPICAALAEAGARVVGLDQWPGGNLWPCNVTIPGSLEAALARIQAGEGLAAPHGLLLLHGLDAKPGTNDADPWRSWDDMVSANLTGTANACRVFGEAMVDAGRGSIVTVGSLYAGLSPDQRLYRQRGAYVASQIAVLGSADDDFTKPAAYSASKAGVLGLTRYLAGLWGSAGVRVNCLSPGGIGSESTPPEFRERFSDRVPLGRMGTPGDLVGAIIWLLSDASAYVTGQEIRVDGGCGLFP